MQQNESLTFFKKMVEQKLRKIKPNKTKTNIWNTIKEIEKKKDIVIRPADNGGGLVILDKRDYELDMEKLLKTPNTYKKLKGNPKEQKFKSYIQRGEKRGILTKKEAKYLVPEAAKLQSSTMSPKFIKNNQIPPVDP